MGSLDAILHEELQRLRAAEQSYRREIRKLPRGSIQCKRIKGRGYPYLAFRKAGKVIYRYLGRLSHDTLEVMQREIAQRQQYERLAAEARRNRHRLEKMTHGSRRAV